MEALQPVKHIEVPPMHLLGEASAKDGGELIRGQLLVGMQRMLRLSDAVEQVNGSVIHGVAPIHLLAHVVLIDAHLCFDVKAVDLYLGAIVDRNGGPPHRLGLRKVKQLLLQVGPLGRSLGHVLVE